MYEYCAQVAGQPLPTSANPKCCQTPRIYSRKRTKQQNSNSLSCSFSTNQTAKRKCCPVFGAFQVQICSGTYIEAVFMWKTHVVNRQCGTSSTAVSATHGSSWFRTFQLLEYHSLTSRFVGSFRATLKRCTGSLYRVPTVGLFGDCIRYTNTSYSLYNIRCIPNSVKRTSTCTLYLLVWCPQTCQYVV